MTYVVRLALMVGALVFVAGVLAGLAGAGALPPVSILVSVALVAFAYWVLPQFAIERMSPEVLHHIRRASAASADRSDTDGPAPLVAPAGRWQPLATEATPQWPAPCPPQFHMTMAERAALEKIRTARELAVPQLPAETLERLRGAREHLKDLRDGLIAAGAWATLGGTLERDAAQAAAGIHELEFLVEIVQLQVERGELDADDEEPKAPPRSEVGA